MNSGQLLVRAAVGMNDRVAEHRMLRVNAVVDESNAHSRTCGVGGSRSVAIEACPGRLVRSDTALRVNVVEVVRTGPVQCPQPNQSLGRSDAAGYAQHDQADAEPAERLRSQDREARGSRRGERRIRGREGEQLAAHDGLAVPVAVDEARIATLEISNESAACIP
jgi:hypothetical protein